MTTQKILVVENEALIAAEIAARLRSQGYAVTDTVAAGDEALASVMKTKPDLVLMDIRLPGKRDGIEIAMELRKQDIPVVFLTAYADDETIARAGAAEPFGYIVKPFQPAELHAAVETGLVKHRAIMAVLRANERELSCAVEEVYETEHRYRQLFEGVIDAILVYGGNGLVLDCNKAAGNLLNYQRRELLHLAATDLFHPDCHAALTDKERHLWSGDSILFEAVLCRRNGTNVPVEVNARRIGYGEEHAILAVVRDISERKRAQETLRLSEARYLSIIEDQSELICRYLPDGRISFVNGAYARYYGQKPEDLLGQSFMPVIPEPDLSRVLERVGGISSAQPIAEFEHRVIMSDASVRWQHWTHRGIMARDGILIEYQAVGRDITDRQNIQEHLERQTAEQHAILENALVGIAFLKDRSFVWINSRMEQMFGYSRDEVRGLKTECFYPSREGYEQLGAEAYPLLTGGGTYQTEQLMRRKDGNLFWCSLSGKAVVPTDPAAGSIWILQDNTDRHERERELALEQQRLDAIDRLSREKTDNIEEFLGRAFNEAARLLESPYGFCGLYEQDSGTIRNIAFTPGVGQDCAMTFAPGSFSISSTGFWAEAARRNEPLLVNDFAAAHERKRELPADHIRITRILCVPILSDGRLVALAAVANKDEDYTPGDVRQFTLLMESLWEIGRRKQAELDLNRSREGILRLNVELEDRVRERTAQLKALSLRLIEVQEEERRHLALELHDQVGQVLTGLKYGVEYLVAELPEPKRDEGQGVVAAIGELLSSVRGMSLNLRPPILDDFGLVPALKWDFGRVGATTGLRIAFDCRGEPRRFDQHVEIALYRIAQEAITNVVRHAGVREAAVELSFGEKEAVLKVEDCGIGFVTESWNIGQDSTGLSGMSERAMLLGGMFSVDSNPGEGTRVTAAIPLRA